MFEKGFSCFNSRVLMVIFQIACSLNGPNLSSSYDEDYCVNRLYNLMSVHDKCYIFFFEQEALNFSDAMSYCKQLGLHLMRIDNMSSTVPLLSANESFRSFAGDGLVLLGATYSIGAKQFLWVDNNEPVGQDVFENVNAGQYGDGDCLALTSNSSVVVQPCSELYKAMCMGLKAAWFGSGNNLKCNCRRGLCSPEGRCLDLGGKCAIGWFGDTCQFRDLLANVTNLLTDGDDTTCADLMSSPLELPLNKPYYLFWIRVVAQNDGDLEDVHVDVLKADGEISQRVDRRHFVIDQKTSDIYCPLNRTLVSKVTLRWAGTKSLCSVNSFGGRNVALKETAYMGSLLASFTTDGNYGIFSRKTETVEHTLYMELSRSRIVHEIGLFRHSAHSILKFEKFSLKLRSKDEMILKRDNDGLHAFADTEVAAYVMSGTLEFVHKMTIKLIDPSKVLDIAEVEVFGDCAPPYYGLECYSLCPETCKDSACHYTGECYQCESGTNDSWSPTKLLTISRSSGTKSTGVTNTTGVTRTTDVTRTTETILLEKECPMGYSGKKCKHLCHCTNRLCDKYGQCSRQSTCAKGWFALSCQYMDLAASAVTNHPHANDNNDLTCYEPIHNTVSAEFNENFYFTWVRVVFGETATVSELSVHYAMFGRELQCSHSRTVEIERSQYDLYCAEEIVTTQIRITWKGRGSLCSLYVSGGRNLAANGKIRLSNISEPAVEKRLWSALTDGAVTNSDCEIFSSEDTNTLTINYDQKKDVFKIVIYTDAIENSTNGFSLNGVFNENFTAFEYMSAEVGRHVVFSSTHRLPGITSIHIVVTNGSLWFCELEVFGECSPPHYDLDCDQTCLLMCYRTKCNYNRYCYHCSKGRHGKYCTEVDVEEFSTSTLSEAGGRAVLQPRTTISFFKMVMPLALFFTVLFVVLLNPDLVLKYCGLTKDRDLESDGVRDGTEASSAVLPDADTEHPLSGDGAEKDDDIEDEAEKSRQCRPAKRKESSVDPEDKSLLDAQQKSTPYPDLEDRRKSSVADQERAKTERKASCVDPDALTGGQDVRKDSYGCQQNGLSEDMPSSS